MKFSIVIPVYNVAPYLRACLDSVAAAMGRLESLTSAADVEVVCVNDGSTDESAAILEEYEERLSLRVFSQPNLGVAAARNKALSAAVGDWVLFVDADDAVRDTVLVDVYEALKRHDMVDIVGFGLIPVYDGVLRWTDDVAESEYLDIRSDIPSRLAEMSVCQFAYRRSVLPAVGFAELTCGEDIVFVSEVLSRASACCVIPRSEYAYYFRAGSAVHAEPSPRKIADAVEFNRRMFAVLALSGKRLGRRFVAGRSAEWIRNLPRTIGSMQDADAACKIWDQWLKAMAEARTYGFLPSRMRMLAHIAVWARSRCAVAMVCNAFARVFGRMDFEGEG